MTKIEWTDATWNPVTGCTKVSAGCQHCYAARMAQRLCSMGDLFHEDVPGAFRTAVWATMAEAGQHTFQVLTKRPRLMHHWLTVRHAGAEPLSNVWLGVTAENQEAADERIPLLLQTPAAVRFVSCEPLLGPVDLREWLGTADVYDPFDNCETYIGTVDGIDWVIAGGETGPGARPMHPAWARSLRDQCRDAGVPFFMKKMAGGEPPPDDLLVREYPEVLP